MNRLRQANTIGQVKVIEADFADVMVVAMGFATNDVLIGTNARKSNVETFRTGLAQVFIINVVFTTH